MTIDMSEGPDVPRPGCPKVRMSEGPNGRRSRCPKIRMSGSSIIRRYILTCNRRNRTFHHYLRDDTESDKGYYVKSGDKEYS